MEDAGHPPPKVELHLNRSSDLVPLESGLTTVQYFPTIEESGSEFFCVWKQVGPLGQVLYQGKEVGPPLEVVMAPYIASNIPSILTYEEGMELRVTFEAKPPPSVEEINWLPLYDGMVVKMLEELEKPHTFETIVTIFNQTEDFDLELIINNSVGSSKKLFTISVDLPTTPFILPSPSMDQFLGSSSAGSIDRTTGTVAGLVGLIIFTILLILITVTILRSRRRKEQSKSVNTGKFRKLEIDGNIILHIAEDYRRVPLISVEAPGCDTITTPGLSLVPVGCTRSGKYLFIQASFCFV